MSDNIKSSSNSISNSNSINKAMFHCYGYCNAKSYDMKSLEQCFQQYNIGTRKIEDSVYFSKPFDNETVEVFYLKFGSVVICGGTHDQRKYFFLFF
jgi:uncharacterized Rmd1/YagE family protein